MHKSVYLSIGLITTNPGTNILLGTDCLIFTGLVVSVDLDVDIGGVHFMEANIVINDVLTMQLNKCNRNRLMPTNAIQALTKMNSKR